MDSNKNQILEPVSSMIELALLSFSKNKPKLSIKHHGIVIKNSGEGYVPRYISRYIYGESKEDLIILHPMIINYLNWFIIDNKNKNKNKNNNDDNYFMYKNIALCAINGLKQLQSTYKIGNVVFALQYYINIILKTIIDTDNIINSINTNQQNSFDSEYSDDFIDDNDNDNDNNKYIKQFGTINDNITLMKWSIPINNEVSIVDIEKIKTIWNMTDLKNVYDMLCGCYDMKNYDFVPKSDSVVEAKVKALKEVLYNKDNEFNIIIRKSYG
jgi:hypothetical protein